jgi:hypothetical protein
MRLELGLNHHYLCTLSRGFTEQKNTI